MKKKNFIPFIAISVLCAACHDKTTLTGDWIEPVPGTTNTIQGFSLKENGEATSINMATLQYKSWTQEDNRLILSGESIGNHQTISFSDTLKIFKLSKDSLILKKVIWLKHIHVPEVSFQQLRYNQLHLPRLQ